VKFLRLALPVVLSYLGLMLMGFVDLLCVGRVSPLAVGAVGTGNTFFSCGMVFGIGLLSGLEYRIGFAHGARDPKGAWTAFVQGLWISLGLGAVLTLGLLLVSDWFGSLGVNSELVPLASVYLKITALSLIPSFVFTAARQYLQGRGSAVAAMWILIIANLLNLLGNYVFVLGNWRSPQWGAVGSAWVTVVSRIFMMIAMLACALYKEEQRRKVGWILDRNMCRELIRLGLPSGMQMVLEVGVFALATILASRLEPLSIAAHHIVLNLASMTFMIPLGIGSATAVLVGQSMGAKDPRAAARTGWHGLKIGIGFMAFSCAVMLAAPQVLLGVYSQNEAILAVARDILFLAALFQLADGAQVVGTGALRGAGDTRFALIANLCGHWVVGLPMGLWLGFGIGMGLRGIWMGLALGLVVVAIALLLRWRLVARRIVALESGPI